MRIIAFAIMRLSHLRYLLHFIDNIAYNEPHLPVFHI